MGRYLKLKERGEDKEKQRFEQNKDLKQKKHYNLKKCVM